MDKQQNKLWDYLNMYGTYNKTLDDLKKYNRADTVNMSEQEMNKFRHIAGPAYLTSRYYPGWLTNTLGYGKEVKDVLMGRGIEDTLYDLGNNQKGIIIGQANRNVKGDKKSLFDYIFETEIKPYREKQ